ncbi:MAG: hypothetical protein GKR90_10640 [Pseudomonadales bacterium]|nr:hypothetical protein [Pseudomonadales bacterium]
MQTDGVTVETIDANASGGSAPSYIVGTAAGVYFKGNSAAGREEIWLTQGTTATTSVAFANPDSFFIQTLE